MTAQSLFMAICEGHTWKIRAKSTSQVRKNSSRYKTVFGNVCSNLLLLLSRTGVGDFHTTDINFLPDPCPLPDAQKKRALNEKERLLYAPMAGVGGLVYDKDAVYIDLPANHINQQVLRFSLRNMMTSFEWPNVCNYGTCFVLPQEEVRPTTELVQSLIDTHTTLDVKIAKSKMSVFKDSITLDSTGFDKQNRWNTSPKRNQ